MLIIIIVVLAATIISKLALKHEVAAAQVISDKAIADIQKRDGTAAWKLGSKKFQSTFSQSQLTKQFQAIEVATLKPPTLKVKTAFSGPSGKSVFFIYEYDALKVPYYIRTAVSNTSAGWQLTNISGSDAESDLLVN